MFKRLFRKILPNPFDRILIKALRAKKKNFLLAWNRGIGDIPLGLFVLVLRIKWFIPDANVTFLIRKDLFESFSLFPYVHILIAKNWKRGERYDVIEELNNLKISAEDFDVIIEKPDPTYWAEYQISKVMPYLYWDEKLDALSKEFFLKNVSQDENRQIKYIAVQIDSDTEHSPWRDYSKENWQKLFTLVEKRNIGIKFLIFGKKPKVDKDISKKFSNIIDLRGRTTFLEAISIIKNRCSFAILPDGGILSILYFLNKQFDIKIVSLWGDVQGVLKQDVDSPNKKLKHVPLYFEKDINKINPIVIFNEIKKILL